MQRLKTDGVLRRSRRGAHLDPEYGGVLEGLAVSNARNSLLSESHLPSEAEVLDLPTFGISDDDVPEVAVKGQEYPRMPSLAGLSTLGGQQGGVAAPAL